MESTTKIYGSEGILIGTGFYILPNILVSCLHVFYDQKNKRFSNPVFSIDEVASEITLKPENVFIVEGLDLIAIDLGVDCGRVCVPLKTTAPKIKDLLWGYSYNKDYEATAITSTLIEESIHQHTSVYRIEDDAIERGSSGTPLWNESQNTLLGVVYWLKAQKQNALVIPAQNFAKHFPDLFEKNLSYHAANPYWEAAIARDETYQGLQKNETPKKKPALSEQFEIYSHEYVGRAEPRKELSQFLRNDQHFLFIYGIGGIGKSHLVKSVIEDLKIPFVYIRLTPSTTLQSLAYQLGISSIDAESNDLPDQSFIAGAKEISECIIIDDFYEIEDDVKLQNTLVYLANINQGKVILISRALDKAFTGSSVTVPTLPIKYLGREEHVSFVEKFIKFKEQVRFDDFNTFEKQLWNISKGHPLISQIIINYSTEEYFDFDINELESWDFEEDEDGKIFIAKLLDTVLIKGSETEKQLLFNLKNSPMLASGAAY